MCHSLVNCKFSIEATQIEDLPGFDNSAGHTWIYPTNYPFREYQFSIVQTALFNNTMVVLPTGLGKTFIAAVVMYNFYRWYPQGAVAVFCMHVFRHSAVVTYTVNF